MAGDTSSQPATQSQPDTCLQNIGPGNLQPDPLNGPLNLGI